MSETAEKTELQLRLEKLPWHVRDYISRSNYSIVDSNTCDYRCTSTWELDRNTEQLIARWEAGQAVALTPEEERQLQALDKLELGQYGGDALCEERINGKWVLVPRWKRGLERFRQLREIFCGSVS